MADIPTASNPGLAKLLDQIDAHVFTGDTMFDKENRQALLWYCGRWTKTVVEDEFEGVYDPDDDEN